MPPLPARHQGGAGRQDARHEAAGELPPDPVGTRRERSAKPARPCAWTRRSHFASHVWLRPTAWQIAWNFHPALRSSIARSRRPCSLSRSIATSS